MSENAMIPDGHVKMTITTSRFARTRNGAWVSNGASSREVVVTFEEARRYSFGRCDTVFFEYRDGTCESLDMGNDPCRFFSSDAEACTLKMSRALGKIGYYGPGRD